MLPKSTEWPTVAVFGLVVAGLAALVAWGDRIPAVVAIGLLGLFAAWYNSLQHEIVHGHPTPWPRVNSALGSVPMGLTYSLAHYRTSHLAHHRDESLTEPGLDPESFYVSETEWAARSPLGRRLLIALQTLAGRMLLGPPVYALRYWRRQLRSARTDRATRRTVAAHVVAVTMVVAVIVAAPLALWVYVVGVAWVGAATSGIRSFAEHRWVESGSRTAVVRSGRFFSLLFLNNNLHVTHHDHPGLAWYLIPAEHDASHGDLEALQGAGLYRGYAEVFARYFVRPSWRPVHGRPSSTDRIAARR